MEEKINACQTLAELVELERAHLLNEEEQRLVFGRRLKNFVRIREDEEPFYIESVRDTRKSLLRMPRAIMFSLATLLLMLNLLLFTSVCIKYSKRFWMRPLATFRNVIEYVLSSFYAIGIS